MGGTSIGRARDIVSTLVIWIAAGIISAGMHTSTVIASVAAVRNHRGGRIGGGRLVGGGLAIGGDSLTNSLSGVRGLGGSIRGSLNLSGGLNSLGTRGARGNVGGAGSRGARGARGNLGAAGGLGSLGA